MCLCLHGATRTPCSLGFLGGRYVGLKGSTGYRMMEKAPYLHTSRKLIFFQTQALEKMNYVNLFFSNHGLQLGQGKKVSKRGTKVSESLAELSCHEHERRSKEVVADPRARPGVGSCADESSCRAHCFLFV